MKKNDTKKATWLALLLLDLFLFTIALLWQVYLLNFVVIAIAVVIYKYGNPILFKAFDAERQQKSQEQQKIREAITKTLRASKNKK